MMNNSNPSTDVPSGGACHGLAAAKSGNESTDEPIPLSGREFRIYNRMAETMNMFHTHFRRVWDQMYSACQEDRSETMQSSLTAPRLIHMGLEFVSHLTMHHDIEEQHIFPLLGEKMPMFRHSEYESGEMTGPIQQHREIHAGLDRMQEYLSACKIGEADFRRQELRSILDGFRDVLWTHLDEEVRFLGAENMRKYWSIEEMRSMPM